MRERLPASATVELGPDATGLGWVFQYVLVDESHQHSLAELKSLQEWYVRYYLRALPGVAEVATVGGFRPQYQVNVDPNRLRALHVTMQEVIEAVRGGNSETSGGVLAFGGSEFMIRGRGYAGLSKTLKRWFLHQPRMARLCASAMWAKLFSDLKRAEACRT